MFASGPGSRSIFCEHKGTGERCASANSSSRHWLFQWDRLHIRPVQPGHGTKCTQPGTRSGEQHVDRITRIANHRETREHVPKTLQFAAEILRRAETAELNRTYTASV